MGVQFTIAGRVVSLYVAEINIPLLLEYFELETFSVSRYSADLGIGLKTMADIAKCRMLFEKRELAGAIRPRQTKSYS